PAGAAVISSGKEFSCEFYVLGITRKIRVPFAWFTGIFFETKLFPIHDCKTTGICKNLSSMNDSSDTIAAIATAPGEAGIAIIRISGTESLKVADRIFSHAGEPPSRRPPGAFMRGFVKSDERVLDEVLLLIMRAPHSYTCEDVVEIQCHGGFVSARRILQAILAGNVRIAEPGEFTKRAFLNGRIDLVQAEAVLDLIRAQSDRSATAALEQLEGLLSASFNDIYDNMARVCADLEAVLDFSEDDAPPGLVPESIAQAHKILEQINCMLATWEEGHLLREGALVVISGRPNVGKSTLLNALLGRNRAIVSPMPGTTRDTIEETIIMGGFPVRLVDTAGLRTTTCTIEQEGIRRARSHMQKADLHLYIMDASKPIDSEDEAHLKSLRSGKSIIIVNKIDLGILIQEKDIAGFVNIKAQLSLNKGLTEIQNRIIEQLGITFPGQAHAVIAERHKKILKKSHADIREAVKILESGQDDAIVPAISYLRFAIESLGQITGKVYHVELLNSIFSRFCIGK
ncbi:MAG: tRNA uridine-5-carboxymethylaminomethyl(34) synthesis GTPase MnmE, partial [Kiritimatiellia bacterium]|nr:tRNA uridine-5-carboxymethylaminomethyl(34) synthesis GTPase MnmE [Kiritimatiellia bacterium]